MSVGLHGRKALEKEAVIDTTVQEKNITFPTDTKLRVKIIGSCRKIARKEGLVLRRSFTRELPGLLRTVRFSGGKNKPARKTAQKRIKTTAGILTRELWRKLRPAQLARHRETLESGTSRATLLMETHSMNCFSRSRPVHRPNLKRPFVTAAFEAARKSWGQRSRFHARHAPGPVSMKNAKPEKTLAAAAP
jgi:hypothetical protein